MSAASIPQRKGSRAHHLNQPLCPALVQLKWRASACKFQRPEYPRRLRRAEGGKFAFSQRIGVFVQLFNSTKSPVPWREHVVPVPHFAYRQVRSWPVCPLENANLRGANPRPLDPCGAKGLLPLASPAGPPTPHIRSLTAALSCLASLIRKLPCQHLLPLMTARPTCRPFVSARSRPGIPAPR